MPTLVLRNPDGSTQDVEVVGTLTIGRADENDLVLVEGGVSRSHARLTAQGDGLVVEDLGSSNGTFVDGMKVEGPTPVAGKAVLALGSYELRLKNPAAYRGASPQALVPVKTHSLPPGQVGAQRAGLKRPAPGPAGGPRLVGVQGNLERREFALAGKVLVGRVEEAQLLLDDESVSRRHAEVEVRGKRVVVKDLGSANGTHVNGTAITLECELKPGDVVQFGAVPLVYDDGGGAAKSVFARLRRRRRGGDTLREDLPHDAPMDPRHRRLLVLGGVALVLLLAGAGALVVLRRPAAPPAPRKLVEAPKDPAARAADKVETALRECRAAGDPEQSAPDWDKALAACQRALAEDPINAEAAQLVRRIGVERPCRDAFERGQTLLDRDREEDALVEFAKVAPDCADAVKVPPLVRDARARVQKRAGEDCLKYAAASQWPQAEPRCRTYLDLACGGMKATDLAPPPGKKLALTGRLKKHQWRPTERHVLALYTAQQKLGTAPPGYACTAAPASPDDAPQDPCDAWRPQFQSRFGDPTLVRALGLYCQGKVREAQPLLQKLRQTVGRAKWHAAADALYKDFSTAQGLFNDGESELAQGRPDKAAGPFQELLELDAQLMLGDGPAAPQGEERQRALDRAASFFRRTARQEMAEKSYQAGKALADRKDVRAACRAWKLGYGFYRGDQDLLRAATYCTQQAAARFGDASECQGLAEVLEYAVDGDGFAEKVATKKAALGCP